ncbi:triose-phosphate isomerase [Patescibacteria group bacterium]
MKRNNMSAKGGSASGGSKIIMANWKMNLSISQSQSFIKKIKKNKNTVAVAAPFTFLTQLTKIASAKGVKLAAQNVSQYEPGAFTGEIAAKMIKETGCSYCLVGHSERRVYFKETDQVINQKLHQLLANKIKPVLCFGENAIERKKGLTKKVIARQLKQGLQDVKDPSKLIIAYEPIWAISTFQKGKIKQSAEIQDIIDAHEYTRKVLASMYKRKAAQIKILYGGSVKPANSQEILSLKQVDGALVGGASLKVSSFNAIIQSI